MLIVLSTMGRGNLESLGLQHFDHCPYININGKHLNSSSRKMMRSYVDLIKFIENDLPIKLLNKREKLQELVEGASKFTSQIALEVENANYGMQDKITAIKNTNKNYKDLQEAPAYLDEMQRIIDETSHSIIKGIKKVQDPQFADILILKGIQARTEGLKCPGDIISRYG